MLEAHVRNALNRLLVIHGRSFPQYMEYARPYAPGAEHEKLEVVEQVASDQQQMADRLVTFLMDAGETLHQGQFPMEFTDVHDLSIDYLLKEMVAYQREDIAAMESCVKALQDSPSAAALAEEALGMAKGHLHLLEEAIEGADDRPAITSRAG